MKLKINLVIFASRENLETLIRTVSSALNNAPQQAIIDIIINGNSNLASQLSEWLLQQSKPEQDVNIWHIPQADKANAWNQHIHSIWRGLSHSIYIDGYVRVSKVSINEIVNTLNSNPDAIGSSGIPTCGFSSKKLQKSMIKDGGFHGNLCSLKNDALSIFKKRKIKIPVGMYRVDSIVGAFLSFNLDNISNQWNPKKYIPVSYNASWDIDDKKFYRLKDIKSWFKRRQRQTQGEIENLAVKYHLTIEKVPLEKMPGDLNSLYNSWKKNDQRYLDISNSFSSRHKKAVNTIINYKVPEEKELEPVLILSVPSKK